MGKKKEKYQVQYGKGQRWRTVKTTGKAGIITWKTMARVGGWKLRKKK